MVDKESKRSEGSAFEEVAASYLKNKGYSVIFRNFLCKMGEIDIVCISPENHLVFVEVKYRTSGASGDPLEAVGPSKQKKICKASLVFLSRNSKYSDLQIRYDVIGIYGDGSIRHIENAFMYEW